MGRWVHGRVAPPSPTPPPPRTGDAAAPPNGGASADIRVAQDQRAALDPVERATAHVDGAALREGCALIIRAFHAAFESAVQVNAQRTTYERLRMNESSEVA